MICIIIRWILRIILSASLTQFKIPAFPGNQTQKVVINSFIKYENETFVLLFFFFFFGSSTYNLWLFPKWSALVHTYKSWLAGHDRQAPETLSGNNGPEKALEKHPKQEHKHWNKGGKLPRICPDIGRVTGRHLQPYPLHSAGLFACISSESRFFNYRRLLVDSAQRLQGPGLQRHSHTTELNMTWLQRGHACHVEKVNGFWWAAMCESVAGTQWFGKERDTSLDLRRRPSYCPWVIYCLLYVYKHCTTFNIFIFVTFLWSGLSHPFYNGWVISKNTILASEQELVHSHALKTWQHWLFLYSAWFPHNRLDVSFIRDWCLFIYLFYFIWTYCTQSAVKTTAAGCLKLSLHV